MKARPSQRRKRKLAWKADHCLTFAAKRYYRADKSPAGYSVRRANRGGWLSVRVLRGEPAKFDVSNLRLAGDPNSTLELVASQAVSLNTVSEHQRIAEILPRSTLRDCSGAIPADGPASALL